MGIKSLLAQKRTKVILTFLYFITALVLLALTWTHKIAVGSFAGFLLLWLGVGLMCLLRSKGDSGAAR